MASRGSETDTKENVLQSKLSKHSRAYAKGSLSMDEGVNFCSEHFSVLQNKLCERHVSMKGSLSMDEGVNFCSEDSSVVHSMLNKTYAKPRRVSMLSTFPVDEEINSSAYVRTKHLSLMGLCGEAENSSSAGMRENYTGNQLETIFEELEHKTMALIRHEQNRFKQLLSSDCAEISVRDDDDEVREEALEITLYVLRKMKQTDLADLIQIEHPTFCMKKHKSRLREMIQRINEGRLRLNEINIELHVLEGVNGEVNIGYEESEMWKTSIKCTDIFKTSPGLNKPPRTVLTKGAAGAGKTFSVQKFILDWAEGNANQHVDFIFLFPLRELNFMGDKNITLIELLGHFCEDAKYMRTKDFDDYKVLLVFDGLDECDLPLDFHNNAVLCDASESARVDVLLTNLIMGNLLPSAFLWVTCKPATANQIPLQYFDLVTEVQVFNEFIMSRYSKSEEVCLKLISFIKAFKKADLSDCNLTENSCSAVASALKLSSNLTDLNLSYNKLRDSGVKLLCDGLKDPNCKLKTLEMYNCSIGEEGCSALASALASNPSHLRELNLNWNTMKNSGIKAFSSLLKDPHCELEKLQFSHCEIGAEDFVVLASALKSNPSHIRELNLSENKLQDSAVMLLSKLLKDQHCKLESLQLDFCGFGKEGCDALVSALISNPSHLRKLNLSENKLGDTGLISLSNLLKDTKCKLERLQLCGCSASKMGCDALVAALKLNPSHLRELNLSKNNPGDPAMKQLFQLLNNPLCNLEKLQLEFCGIGKKSCAALVSALESNHCHLRELNLNYNKPGDSGVKLQSGLLKDHSQLKKIRLFRHFS